MEVRWFFDVMVLASTYQDPHRRRNVQGFLPSSSPFRVNRPCPSSHRFGSEQGSFESIFSPCVWNWVLDRLAFLLAQPISQRKGSLASHDNGSHERKAVRSSSLWCETHLASDDAREIRNASKRNSDVDSRRVSRSSLRNTFDPFFPSTFFFHVRFGDELAFLPTRKDGSLRDLHVIRFPHSRALPSRRQGNVFRTFLLRRSFREDRSLPP